MTIKCYTNIIYKYIDAYTIYRKYCVANNIQQYSPQLITDLFEVQQTKYNFLM